MLNSITNIIINILYSETGYNLEFRVFQRLEAKKGYRADLEEHYLFYR